MGLNYKIKCVLKYKNGLPITTNKGGETPAALNAFRAVAFRLPSTGGLVDCFRVSFYSDLAGLPSSRVLGSGICSPSNLLLGDCRCSMFFTGLILLSVLENQGLEGTPWFPLPRGIPLVLPRHWQPPNYSWSTGNSTS